jgi:hypothetical protein
MTSLTAMSSLPPEALKILTIVLAGVTVLFCSAMFAFALVKTWRSKAKPPDFGDAFLYVATALASLIGGIVAVAFGQAPPRPSLLLGSLDWLAIMATVYAIAYLSLGIASLVTWVLKADVTPAVVKNLATTFLGLLLPIVGSFFHGGGFSG